MTPKQVNSDVPLPMIEVYLKLQTTSIVHAPIRRAIFEGDWPLGNVIFPRPIIWTVELVEHSAYRSLDVEMELRALLEED